MRKLFSKILAFAMIVTLVLPVLSLTALGAAAGAIAVSKTEMYKTDTVTVSYRLSGNTMTVGSAQMVLSYDNQAFEVVSYASDYFTLAPSNYTVNAADSTVRFSISGGSQNAAAGAIVTVTFRPTANAVVGTTYEFAFGGKGRTALQVSSSPSVHQDSKPGDIVATTTAEKITKANVKIIEKPKYTVTYTDGVEGATLFADQTYTVETGSATPKFQGTPKRNDYVFSGWTPAVANTVTKNVTYTAVWKKAATKYTVTYTDGVDGETVFADQKYTVDEGSATPKFQGTPTRAGYTFKEWTPAVAVNVTGNITYTAQWEKETKTFTVRYTDGVEGEEIFADQTFTVKEGDAFPAFSGTPVREGYLFKGWNTPAGTVSADTVITPVWQPAPPPSTTFAVIYTDGVADDVIFADQIYAAEKDGNTPAFNGNPTRPNHVFLGWSPVVAPTVTADVIYTAMWREKTADFESVLASITGEDEEIRSNMRLKEPAGGDAFVRDFNVRIEDDGYTTLILHCGTGDSPIPASSFIQIDNEDTGVCIYSGAIGNIPADLPISLNGKAGETVRVRMTLTVDQTLRAGSVPSAELPVSFTLGDRDACHCPICAVIRVFGGPYCCCHLCIVILILVIIILVLIGVIIWLMYKKNKPEDGNKEETPAPENKPEPAPAPKPEAKAETASSYAEYRTAKKPDNTDDDEQ